jgi:uncharacterized RDD family membrane protein YckC
LPDKETVICPKCGAHILRPPIGAERNYIGFWIRFGAALIDWIILLAISLIFLAMLFALFLASIVSFNIFSLPSSLLLIVIMTALWLGVGFGYYTIMESSSAQATFGKQLMAIKVVDEQGNRISLGRSALRNILRHIPVLSWFILIGYLLIAFTDKKQGLHDMIAGTYVIAK